MKNLINIILFSILITNASFANTFDQTEQIETNSLIQSQEKPKQSQPDDINQKLQEIEEILKYIALMQIKTEETNQKQPTIENSRTNIQTRTSKSIALIKSTFNNSVGAGKFVIDRINNIMSKKFLIAACLILGPSVYAYTKLKPDLFPDMTEVITEKMTDTGIKMGEQIVDGAIKGAMNNKITMLKIAGFTIAMGSASELIKYSVIEGIPAIIKLTATGLALTGKGIVLLTKHIAHR